MRVRIAVNPQIEEMMRNSFFYHIYCQLFKQKHSYTTIISVLNLIRSEYENLIQIFAPLQLLEIIKSQPYPKENIEALVDYHANLLSLGFTPEAIINMIADADNPVHLDAIMANAAINNPTNYLLREVEQQLNVIEYSKKRSRAVHDDLDEELDADFVPLRKKMLKSALLYSIFFPSAVGEPQIALENVNSNSQVFTMKKRFS